MGTLDNGIIPRGGALGRTVVSIVSTTSLSGLTNFGEGSYLGNLFRQLLSDGNNMTAAT